MEFKGNRGDKTGVEEGRQKNVDFGGGRWVGEGNGGGKVCRWRVI